MDKPQNLNDLRKFYCEEYLPLYDYFMAESRLPQELHFEVAAAFDHMMRKGFTENGDIYPEEFDRMVGHLKRATYDSFKLIFENIRQRIDRFMDPRYKDVEDGKFQPRMCELFNQARAIAIEARHKERNFDKYDYSTWGDAFEVWKQLLPITKELTDLEGSEKILRVDNPPLSRKIKTISINLFWSLVGAVLSLILCKLF